MGPLKTQHICRRHCDENKSHDHPASCFKTQLGKKCQRKSYFREFARHWTRIFVCGPEEQLKERCKVGMETQHFTNKKLDLKLLVFMRSNCCWFTNVMNVRILTLLTVASTICLYHIVQSKEGCGDHGQWKKLSRLPSCFWMERSRLP